MLDEVDQSFCELYADYLAFKWSGGLACRSMQLLRRVVKSACKRLNKSIALTKCEAEVKKKLGKPDFLTIKEVKAIADANLLEDRHKWSETYSYSSAIPECHIVIISYLTAKSTSLAPKRGKSGFDCGFEPHNQGFDLVNILNGGNRSQLLYQIINFSDDILDVNLLGFAVLEMADNSLNLALEQNVLIKLQRHFFENLVLPIFDKVNGLNDGG